MNLIELDSDAPDEATKIISADVPDWTREAVRQFWDPSRKLLATIRAHERLCQRTGFITTFARKLLIIRHRFWSVVTGADIPLNCQIGGGLLIPHPNGIVVHPDAVIGVNCLIFQQVTIGSRGHGGLPIIEGHVDIGAGSKLLGPIKVGKHARIGANCVITKDVPAETAAVGKE